MRAQRRIFSQAAVSAYLAVGELPLLRKMSAAPLRRHLLRDPRPDEPEAEGECRLRGQQLLAQAAINDVEAAASETQRRRKPPPVSALCSGQVLDKESPISRSGHRQTRHVALIAPSDDGRCTLLDDAEQHLIGMVPGVAALVVRRCGQPTGGRRRAPVRLPFEIRTVARRALIRIDLSALLDDLR